MVKYDLRMVARTRRLQVDQHETIGDDAQQRQWLAARLPEIHNENSGSVPSAWWRVS
jgi:hypothetical protein